MIEQKITDLIASIDANTKVLIALAGAPKAAKEPKKTTEPKVEKEVAPEPTGPTKEQVAKAIENCLKAGKKAELIALLKTFKGAGNATAVFDQGPEVSQQFIDSTADLLIGE